MSAPRDRAPEAASRDRAPEAAPREDRDGVVPVDPMGLSDDLDLLDALLDAEGVAAAGAVIPRRGASTAPLSPAQKRLAFLHALDPASMAYTISGAVRLQGYLDVDALRAALDAIVARHASLRTTIVTPSAAGSAEGRAFGGEPAPRPEVGDGRSGTGAPSSVPSARDRRPDDPDDLMQVVHEAMSVPVEHLQGAGGTAAAEAARTAGRLLGAPWDLAKGPLLRAAIVALGPADHLLVLVMHHIVTDGWSTGVLLRELGALYRARIDGTLARLAPLTIAYTDYASWLHEHSEAEGSGESLAYWRAHLDGAPDLLDLPVDRPRPAHRAQRGALLAFRIPAELTRALEALAQREGATLFMALLAAYQALLARWSGQRDVVVGVPIAGRDRAGTEGLVGLFVNTLALRTDLSGDPTFRGLLARVRTTALGAYAHQDTPFEKLVEELRPERSLGRMPLFQVMFAYQDAPTIEELAMPGIATSAIEIDTGTAQFDLSLNLQTEAGALVGSAEYDTELFDEATIGRMLAHYRRLLEAVVVRDGERLSSIRLLDPDERRTALETWSGRGRIRAAGRLFHERFEEQARAHPRRVAAVLGGRRVDYGTIDDRSARLAARLVAMGAGPEMRVGLCLPRGPELAIGMLAALRAGAAFVPLDPGHPADRLRFVYADAQVRIVLAIGETASLVGDDGFEVVRIDEDAAFTLAPLLPSRDDVPESLAYIIYTSGTTGRPKGVMVEHGSISAAFAAWERLYDLTSLRTHLQMAGLGFDVCTADVVRALGSGGTLVFCDRDTLLDPGRLFDLARRERVEIAEFVPAVLRELAIEARARGERLDDVRIAIVGSDVWSAAEVETFRAPFGAGTRLGNGYGVTEATVSSALEWIGDEGFPGASPPIGRPLTHTAVYVLDGALEPAPVGVSGEIYLGGPAVARGYAGRPDLTAERFVPDPFGPPGSRLYRTGDRARWLADGRVVFAGRGDDQVKIRGQRIEPAEVEAAIVAEAGASVSACAVVARPDVSGSVRLVAYVVPAPGATVDVASLRRGLEARLTTAMTPSAITVLAALPLTVNGKVDRRRLPEPEWDAHAAYAPPRTAAEQAVAAAYAGVLGVARVGARDDFFALGGHSLLATRVVSRLRAALGVEVPLRAIFEAPRVRDLAARVASLRGDAVPPPVRRAPEPERGGLSYAQRRLWFLDRLEPGSAAYNLPATLDLDGALDAPALARAVTEVVGRHEALRTRFVETASGPSQTVDPPAVVPLPLLDLSDLDEAARRRESDRIAEDEARGPFDLARGPLLRARLLRLGPSRHRLALTVHHIAFDAWSAVVLVQELARLYAAFTADEVSPLPALPVQYADWAAWQRGWLDGDAGERQLAWWRGALQGAPPLALPSDRPRSPRAAGPGDAILVSLDAPLRERLERLARGEGATLHMALLAAYATALGRWSGQKDVTVGTPVANRRTEEIEPLIGFFVNTLAVRVDLAPRADALGGLTFRGLLARVREASLGALANQDVPFERVVEDLDPERRPGHNPLFQVLFALQNVPVPEVALPGLTLSYDQPETGVVRFDVELILEETREGGVAGAVHYRGDMFDGATIARFVENLCALLDRASREPDRPLADLPTLAPGQMRLVSALGTAGPATSTAASLVHAAFERCAAADPEATAARQDGARISYGELNARANRLARGLVKQGIGPEDLVAVCVERSFDMLVALLGVLKAGAAFVPVDPEYPRERIALILEDSGAPLVVTQSALAARLPVSRVLVLDAEPASDGEALGQASRHPAEDGEALRKRGTDRGDSDGGGASGDAGDLHVDVSPDALAYAVYTSGSTGRPKGVAMSHRAIGNMLQWQASDSSGAKAGTAPRTLQYASLSFDVSIQEIFSTLSAGGEIVLVSEEERRDAPRLLRLLAAARVERLFLPFVALDQIAEAADAEDVVPGSLREVDTAGEQLRITPAIARFFARIPGCRLVNHYGPSEAHLVTTFDLTGDPSGWPELPPIGRPIEGSAVHLLDDEGHLVPIGAPGEIHVGGAGLARGYHARADLTAERFVPSPLPGADGERLYRTGDLARMDAGGTLVFLGRRDLQVKVRGYRVEPGEIEAALARHPGVRQAAVAARDARGGKRLAAYVVVEGEAPAPRALRAFLEGLLPEFMVPAAFVVLPSLPLTPNGKVDRAALPEPEWSAGHESVAPRSPEEEVICGLFAEVLGLSRLPGAHDGFFDLGGHSLLATQVIARVRRALGVEVPLRALFETPTAAGIAAAVDLARRADAPAPPPVGRAGARERRVPSHAQMRLWFLHALDPASSVYNLPGALRLEGRLDAGALSRAIAEIVRRHEALRTRFVPGPDGPEAVVDPPPAPDLPVEDVAPSGEQAPESALRERLAREASRPFDLERGPMLRALLVRISPTEHVLSFVVPHIVADGWSLGVLVREIGVLYRAYTSGLPSPLADPPIQYADWAAWQRAWLAQGEDARQLAWWRRELDGAPATLGLPADRARPAVLTGAGATLDVRLPAPLVARLARLARAEGVTLHMALLAGYAALLMRQTGQDEVVVGTPVANRRTAEAEALIGFFVNTLAVRVRGGGGIGYRPLLAHVREASLGAYANQDVPFERVVESIQPERVLNRAPLFQTAFALQNAPGARPKDGSGPGEASDRSRADSRMSALPDLVTTPVAPDGVTSKFDLMLLVEQTSDGAIEGGFEYSTELFDRDTIEDLASRLTALLEGAVADPDAALATLPLAGVEEERRIVAEWSDGAGVGAGSGRVPLDATATTAAAAPDASAAMVPARIARWIARAPDAPAVVSGGESLTYAELGTRAGRLARRLRALGAGPERPVAVILERSPGAIVAMLAVLESGGVWVPLDPSQPIERLRYFVDDCGARLVIAAGGHDFGEGIEVLALEENDAAARTDVTPRTGAAIVPPILGPAASSVTAAVRPDSLAYIIYTSGSTGRPKGVGVEHRHLTAYVDAAIGRLGLEGPRGGLRYALVSTLAADLGHTSVFPALVTGGCLDILPADIAFDAPAAESWFSQREIDVVKIVPSHLAALLGGPRPERILPRRLLVLGGEATPGARLAAIERLAGGGRVAIHYGPTEATVGAVAGLAEAADAARAAVPLGRPLGHARAYVLDARGRPVPAGTPGELHLAGRGVARGYVGRPDLTAGRFLPDPFAAEPGARMYRTGDRARWLRDGRLEFLGRADGQVKIRGWRVETGEIAAAVRALPGVREAAVVVREEGPSGKSLAAYVVADPRVSPRVGGLARRALPGGLAVAELNRNETDYLHREIFDLRAYVRHGLTIRPGDTVVDAGANIGLFTVFASLAAPGARIVACEPNPALAAILRANAQAYAPDAAVLDVGLSDRRGEADFTFFPGFSLLSGLHADAGSEKAVVRSFLENLAREGEAGAGALASEAEGLLAERFEARTLPVRLRTLSEVMDEQGIERVHLLKVNVEKAELELLRGIADGDWPRIDQCVVEVDVAEHLAPILALFETHGFDTLVEQDPLLESTELRYVYAVRRGSDRTLVPGAPPPPAPAAGPGLLTIEALRAQTGRVLPGYMVPSSWTFLEALPLTANGKLDRARLPDPQGEDRPFTAPVGTLESAIAGIWSEALGVARVGTQDNFFDLGGHSLLLARVHARLRETLGAELTIVELFRYPTIASLARRLASTGGTSGSDPAARPARSVAGRARGALRREAAKARVRPPGGSSPGGGS